MFKNIDLFMSKLPEEIEEYVINFVKKDYNSYSKMVKYSVYANRYFRQALFCMDFLYLYEKPMDKIDFVKDKCRYAVETYTQYGDKYTVYDVNSFDTERRHYLSWSNTDNRYYICRNDGIMFIHSSDKEEIKYELIDTIICSRFLFKSFEVCKTVKGDIKIIPKFCENVCCERIVRYDTDIEDIEDLICENTKIEIRAFDTYKCCEDIIDYFYEEITYLWYNGYEFNLDEDLREQLENMFEAEDIYIVINNDTFICIRLVVNDTTYDELDTDGDTDEEDEEDDEDEEDEE